MAAQHSCKDCGVVFDTGKSLDVHLHYHKENLMTKWGSGGGGNSVGSTPPPASEDNNNVNKKSRAVAPADSSDPGYPNYFHHQQQAQAAHQQMMEYAENGGSAFQRLPRGCYRYQPYEAPPHQQFYHHQAAGQVYQQQAGEEPQAEILDLDSHKVHVYQPPEGEEAAVGGGSNPWAFPYFEPDKGIKYEDPGEDSSPDPGVSTTGGLDPGGYYDPNPPPPPRPTPAWKSNEARRPKTYNCSACNKWFTSSGHLKRHYNTTLHKNAVKQSGGADPANLPVSAHHHPPTVKPEVPQVQQPPPPQLLYDQPAGLHHPPHHHHPQQQGPPLEFVSVGMGGHPPPQPCYTTAYPNALPPHVSSFGNDEPLPSFAQLAARSSVGGDFSLDFVDSAQRDVGGPLHEQLFRHQQPRPEPAYQQRPSRPADEVLLGAVKVEQPAVVFDASPPTEVSSSVSPPLHRCVDCDKTFNKACYLTQHNKSFHSGDKPFKCSRCGKRFPLEYLHLEHLSKHAGDKPYKCEMCPKQFNHKTDLRRHMCLHSGDKPYACELCGKGFIRKDHMLKHCETHRKKGKMQHIL